MLSSTSSTAATITVGETIAFLDGSVSSVARGISENRYALWLGSGISRGRVNGLDRLIRRVLNFIQHRVTIGDVNCRFRRTLRKIVELGNPSPAEYGGIDLDRPII